MTEHVLNIWYTVAGLSSGVVLFLVALGHGLWKEPELLSPQAYQIEQIKAHPVGVGEFPPDLAWPFYTFRQAGIDRRVVRKYLSDLYRRMWKWPSDTFFRGLHGSRLWWWTLLLPVTVTVISFLLLAGLAGHRDGAPSTPGRGKRARGSRESSSCTRRGCAASCAAGPPRRAGTTG